MNLQTTIALNNGVAIPQLGLGVFRSQAGGEAAQAVEWALQAGYRHIDTATIYGNEADVGQGIKNSGLPRSEVFITTKLWTQDMREGRQMAAFEESLRQLDTDYVDLYLLHWPVAGKIAESWQVLEEIYRSGRARAIGVSNYFQHHLDELFKTATVIPAVNQIELHPRLTSPELIACCREKGIAIEAWSPLGGMKGDILTDDVITGLGLKYQKSPAQIVLRWDLQHGFITIPKSAQQQRIIQNANLYDFELEPQDMKAIDALNENRRFGSHPDEITF